MRIFQKKNLAPSVSSYLGQPKYTQKSERTNEQFKRQIGNRQSRGTVGQTFMKPQHPTLIGHQNNKKKQAECKMPQTKNERTLFTDLKS